MTCTTTATFFGLPTGRSYSKELRALCPDPCGRQSRGEKPWLHASVHTNYGYWTSVAPVGLVSGLAPEGWPRSYTVCGPTYPITGQKSQGEPERGVGPCVWLLSGGVRIKTRTTMGDATPGLWFAAAAGSAQHHSCACPNPSLVAPTLVRQGLTV